MISLIFYIHYSILYFVLITVYLPNLLFVSDGPGFCCSMRVSVTSDFHDTYKISCENSGCVLTALSCDHSMSSALVLLFL